MPVAFEAGQAHSLAIDGLKLHARSYGGNVGTPALMFLHGGMAHTAFFDPLASFLTSVTRPFSMDRRGPTLLRDNLPIAGAVLLDIPYDPMAPEMRKTGDRLRRIPQIRYPSEATAKRGFQPYPLPHRAPDNVVKYLADRSFRPSGDGGFYSKFHWTRMRALREHDAGLLEDFPEQFRRITCPVLAVRGGDSTILSAEDHAEMVRRLPEGHGVTLPEATHSLHLEQPEAVAAVIADFLTELPECRPDA